MEKAIQTELESILDSVSMIVKFIKSRPLKITLPNKRATEQDLVMTLCFFILLRKELLRMFSAKNPDIAGQLNDKEWYLKLVVLG